MSDARLLARERDLPYIYDLARGAAVFYRESGIVEVRRRPPADQPAALYFTPREHPHGTHTYARRHLDRERGGPQ